MSTDGNEGRNHSSPDIEPNLNEALDLNRPGGFVSSLPGPLRDRFTADIPEILPRPSGMLRSGVTAQATWPRKGTRVGVGIETPIAHALVDLLLGEDRTPAEGRLQVTPVEWGILSFLFARVLTDLARREEGPLGPWDLSLDRVGPDPFDARDLGPIFTVRWAVRVGEIAGAIRLWLPESLIRPTAPSPPAVSGPWRARAGVINVAKGLSVLKVGRVLPIDGGTLQGTSASPIGLIRLTLEGEGVSEFLTEAEPGSHGRRLIIRSPMIRRPRSTKPELPEALQIELGRVNFPIDRVEALASGDVVQLDRESDSPVSLLSEGRLVARAEWVEIGNELGIRVTELVP